MNVQTVIVQCSLLLCELRKGVADCIRAITQYMLCVLTGIYQVTFQIVWQPTESDSEINSRVCRA